jgi:hypothetical protein
MGAAMLKPLGPIVCLTLASLAGQEPRALTLKDLIVPADRLPAGCALAPKLSEAEGVVTGLAKGDSIPSNPWTGADAQILQRIHGRIDGTTVLLRDVPLTRQNMRHELPEGIEEGYVAVYHESERPGVTTVSALRFASAELARKSSSLRLPDSRKVWFQAGRIRGVVSGDGGPCFQAVGRFLNQLSR